MTESRYADDIALVGRIVDGDRESWATMVERYSQAMRYALVHTHRRYQAAVDDDRLDDMLGDIMLGLVANEFRRLRGYGGRCSLGQWLKVIASNYAIDRLRRRRPTLSLTWSEDGAAEPGTYSVAELVADEPTPEELVDAKRRRRLLAEMIASLPSEDRLFIQLFYVEGRSYEEAAATMGTTLGAVYARRNRIRKRLTALAKKAAIL